MKYLVIFLGLIAFSSLIFALGPVNAEPISIENKTTPSSDSDIKITAFGMFDAEDDGDLVHQLFVGEKYWFNIEYQNGLQTGHDINALVQMIDKNKTEDNVLRKIDGHSFLEPSEGLGDGFEWTPIYAGQFKITAEFTALDDSLVGSVVPQYDFVVLDRPSLKQQLQKITPINDIICKNINHHLVERANGKLACVSLDTAKKLDWKSVEPDVVILGQSAKESLLMRYKDVPEIKAFYARYKNAQSSVREDHVSYFAENPDDSLVRMNLFFDKDYAIEHMELHCYYQNTHQYEVAQEDIVSNLEKYDCKKPE